MAKRFEQLDQNEVFSFNSQYSKDFNLSSNNFESINLKAQEFIEVIKRCLNIGVEAKNILFTQGLECEALRFGAKSWQKGKVKIKVTLEFYPDEPEFKATSVSKELEKKKPEVLSDDLRQRINESQP